MEELKSTNSSLQEDLVDLRQELHNHCNRTKEESKEVLGKWNAKCEALRDNLKEAAARNAEQVQSIKVLQQELADLKAKAAKKREDIENGEIEGPIAVRA